MLNQNTAYLFTWVFNIIYFVGLLPQVFLNHRRRCAKGISDLMLLGAFLAYEGETYYALCLGLPASYKLMIPLSLVAVFIMCMQRFYFCGIKEKEVVLLFLVILGFGVGLIPFSLGHLSIVGNIAGWVGAIMWASYKIPQIIKIRTAKSTVGISFLFILVFTIGSFLEAVAAVALKLPLQTLINGSYGFIINVTLLFYFYKYRVS